MFRVFVSSLLAAAVGSNLCVAVQTSAADVITTTATPKKAGIVAQLHAAHELLSTADHDYDGHRAKAAEEIHLAIKEIVGKHTTKPMVKKAGGAKEAHHEAQATSDEQLQKALGILQNVSGEMTTKHPKAAANVTNAIAEIKTALKIK
jgi:hypothetical protein